MVPSTQHIPLGGHCMPRKESLASFSQLDHERRIMAAWERFLQDGALASSAVRRLIERSWERCRAAGVDPALTQAAAQELTSLTLPGEGAPTMVTRRGLLCLCFGILST